MRGVKQQSRKTKKKSPCWRCTQQAATPGKQLLQPCHRPRCHAGSCIGTFEGGSSSSRATGPDAMLEAAAEFLREVKQQSQNTTKRRSPTSSHQAGCHRPRRQPVSWEAAARLLRGVKRQSRNTRKRGRARGDGKLDATGPDAKLETLAMHTASGNARQTAAAAVPQAQMPCWKLHRNF